VASQRITVEGSRLTAGNVLLADVALSVFVSRDAARAAAPAPSRVIARPYHRVFASCSQWDASIVREFESHARVFGHHYLKDVGALRSEEVWSDRISELIDNADVSQLFWSSNSMASPFVRAEWNTRSRSDGLTSSVPCTGKTHCRSARACRRPNCAPFTSKRSIRPLLASTGPKPRYGHIVRRVRSLWHRHPPARRRTRSKYPCPPLLSRRQFRVRKLRPSAATKSNAFSGAAGWAWSTSHAIRRLAARSLSRCSVPTTRTIAASSGRKRRPRARCCTATSACSSTAASTRARRFWVMEYIRGEALADKIKRKAPLLLAVKLRYVKELCDGLAHAHKAGIVHRGIK
jgi:hypothetical protein